MSSLSALRPGLSAALVAAGLSLGWTALAHAAATVSAPTTGTAETVRAHLAAMAPLAAPFSAQPLELEFEQPTAGGSKPLKLHWQQGQFRITRSWQGIDEAYGYDGQVYWYGSSEALPFSLDHGKPADVTHQFIPNLYYTSPAQAGALRPLNDHELSEASHLPQLGGYLLLDYSPPGMSEAWLLLDPATLLLRGSLLGDAPTLDASSALQISQYGAWRDFAAARYPAEMTVIDVLSDGSQERDHTLRTVSISAGAVLPPGQFSLGSAPPVAQPALPGGQLRLPFRLVDDGITLDATGPDGKPLTFKFDSGANVGLLRRTTALRLGLAPAGAQPVTGHGGTVELQFALLRGVQLGGVELPPFQVAVTAEEGGPQPGSPGYEYYAARLREHGPSLDSAFGEDGVDGLLGTALLSNFVVRIDYAHQQLTLFEAARFAPQLLGPGAQGLPLTRDSMPYTAVTVDGKLAGGAFFNTGARPFFSLASWAVDRAQLNYPMLGVATGLSIHGPQAFGIIQPGVVQLGSLRLERPATFLEMLAPGDAPDESRMASFGSEFFHEHVVTFDLLHERVYVE